MGLAACNKFFVRSFVRYSLFHTHVPVLELFNGSVATCE